MLPVDRPTIPLQDCLARHVYRVEARNFKLAVFDGTCHFIGIRTKFGSRFLDDEGHWDNPEFASCRPVEDTGFVVPEEIPVATGSTRLFDLLDWFDEWGGV